MTKFKSTIQIVSAEVIDTLRRPSRLKKLFKPEAVKKWLRFKRISLRSGNQWVQSQKRAEGLERRVINSYRDYVELQGMKLDYLDLEHHESRFRSALRERLADLEFIKRGKNALCLGARLGGEVRAFVDMGLFAVGVDLNPGQANLYVLHGDFQNLQMADDSADVVYTNSVDHAYDLGGMVREILRVVKADGHIIVEPDPGVEDPGGVQPDLWAVQSWKTTDGLITALEGFGLKLVGRRSFDYPRGGQQLIFVPFHQPRD